MKYCYLLEVERVIAETNLYIVANCFNNCGLSLWSIRSHWEEVKVSRDYLDVQVNHIYREANMVADFLSSLGARGYSSLLCLIDLNHRGCHSIRFHKLSFLLFVCFDIVLCPFYLYWTCSFYLTTIFSLPSSKIFCQNKNLLDCKLQVPYPYVRHAPSTQ